MRTPIRGRKARQLFLCMIPLAPIALLALTGCGQPAPITPVESLSSASSSFPVTITNCGEQITVTKAPTRAITLNQGATETLLALGLKDAMIGTAYLDDEVSSQWKADYDSIPVLSKEYPNQETVLQQTPDFLAASYASAFAEKAAGTRKDLQALNINTYVSPFACEDKSQRPSVASWDAIDAEITDIAKIFGVQERAEKLISAQQEQIATVSAAKPAQGKKIFWFDSGDKTPYVGAGDGAPELIIDGLGGTNIFADLPGNWADGNWETVLQQDPDVIVLADASWSTAKEKEDYLRKDPALKDLTAVKNNAFVTIAFSESTPGVRNVEGLASIADQLASLN